METSYTRAIDLDPSSPGARRIRATVPMPADSLAEVCAAFHYPAGYRPRAGRDLMNDAMAPLEAPGAEVVEHLLAWRADESAYGPTWDTEAPIERVDVWATVVPELWQRQLSFSGLEPLRQQLPGALDDLAAALRLLNRLGRPGAGPAS